MQVVREQRDLASLPEPRFICTAPPWLRRFTVGVLVGGAFIGGAIEYNGLAQDGGVISIVGGLILVAICLSVLVLLRPSDWRAWINLAATKDGLYLVALRHRVVFIPWQDVLEIGVEELQGRRTVRFLRLKMRLPEDGWAAFGKTSAIKGTGDVRQYLHSAMTMPGDTLLHHLKAFRERHC